MFASVKLRILAMIVVLPLVISSDQAVAWEKTQDGLGLGVNTIGSPSSVSSDEAWSGSYVYYGKYKEIPMKYRVLAPSTTEFGDNTLFLDCDTILEKKIPFHNVSDMEMMWGINSLRDWLNDENFLKNQEVFTVAEQAAVALSKKTLPSNKHTSNFIHTCLHEDGDRVFLLDVTELMNPDFGYISGNDNYTIYKSRAKNYHDSSIPSGQYINRWWIRSRYQHMQYTKYGYKHTHLGAVSVEGRICNEMYTATYHDVGVSPAFNVSLSSVIFSSRVQGTNDAPGAEYKLTLRDTSMDINPSTVTRNGDTLTVYYTIAGEHAGNATRVSLLVTDGTWDKDNGWSDGAEVVQYGTVSGNFSTSDGWGTFNLDSNKISGTLGTDYNVYILAEDVNGEQESDYASAPISVAIPASSGSGSQENSAAESGNGSQENSATGSGNGSQENSAAESINGNQENSAAESGNGNQENSTSGSGNGSQTKSAAESGSGNQENSAAESGSGSQENSATESGNGSQENSAAESGNGNQENSATESGNGSQENSATESGNGNQENSATESGNGNQENSAAESISGSQEKSTVESSNGSQTKSAAESASGNQGNSDAKSGNGSQESSAADSASGNQGNGDAKSGNGSQESSAADSTSGSQESSAADSASGGEGNGDAGSGGGCNSGFGGMTSLGLIGLLIATRKKGKPEGK
ncbi:MAG: hypothetical protein K5841_02740 [Fretibacterium sp.]|nr:hypothetical protein [Fretibacterium sp.]